MDDVAAYFQAVTELKPETKNYTTWILIAVNEMKGKKIDQLSSMFEHGYKILLDSGVYSLAASHARKNKVTHDTALTTPLKQIEGFESLMTNWKRVVDEYGNRLWGYIELDIGGRDQKIETRTALEEEGYRPIPVIHPLNDGWDYFDEMADKYDRLCLGNLVNAFADKREHILSEALKRRQGKSVKWIHALGVTPSPTWLAYPTESCDSSSFKAPMMYGGELTHITSFNKGLVTNEVYTTKSGQQCHIIQSRQAGILDSHVKSYMGGTDDRIV